jgi:hypothetical protein
MKLKTIESFIKEAKKNEGKKKKKESRLNLKDKK